MPNFATYTPVNIATSAAESTGGIKNITFNTPLNNLSKVLSQLTSLETKLSQLSTTNNSGFKWSSSGALNFSTQNYLINGVQQNLQQLLLYMQQQMPLQSATQNTLEDNVIRISKTNRTLSVDGQTFKIGISKKGLDLTTKSGDNFTPEGTFKLGNPETKKGYKDPEHGWRPNAYGNMFFKLKGGIAEGRGFGIHGSDQYNDPDKYEVGKVGTHGCISMRNSDLSRFNEIIKSKGGADKFSVVISHKKGGKLNKFQTGGTVLSQRLNTPISDLFVSYKAVYLDPQSVTKYNIEALPAIETLLTAAQLKVESSKARIKESPVFEKWRSSGLETSSSTQLQLSTELTPLQSTQLSQQSAIQLGESVTLAGVQMPKTWVEYRWKQECGTDFGVIDEKHRKGIVVRSNSGKADNKGGKKTYGPGLLYNPETGHAMQTDEPSGGFTTLELTRLFMVLLEKEVVKAKLAGCKTWNQIAAYSGIDGNFGSNSTVIKGLKSMIQLGKSDNDIFNYIAHASDSQRGEFPGLVKRRMWEARTWIGDFDPEGSGSATNKLKVKELNSAKFGGILQRIKSLNL